MRRARVHRSLRIGELVGVAVIVCSLSLVGSAFADGKVFSTADYVAMPHQSATLAWRDGEVFLAIEPAFAGKGSEFAWIVPVPGEVQIEPVTPGTFAMLRRQTAADVIQPQGTGFSTPIVFVWLLVTLLIIVVGFTLDPRRYVSRPARLNDWIVGISVVSFFFLAWALLPTLSIGRGSDEGSDDVTVIRRTDVGSYDTAVLAAKNAEVLTSWLADNGFHIDDAPAVRQAANEYIADGWRFVAVRMRGEQADGSTLTAHPLGFRYRAATPVYPLRLTGAGFPKANRLNVELFIFGEQQAIIDGWKLAYCGQNGNVNHLGVSHVGNRLPFVTRLRASLTPKQMRQDAAIRWQHAEPFQESVFTAEAAANIGLNIAAMLLFALVLYIMRRDVKRGVPHNLKDHAIVVALCVVVAFIAPLSLPQTSEPTIRRWGREYRDTWDRFRIIQDGLSDRYKAAGETGQPVTLEIARQWLAEIVVSEQTLGDGPGQCEMIQSPEGILSVLLHDVRGYSHTSPLGPASAAD